MTVVNEPAAARRRSPGWYIPWLFVAMFAVVVAADGIMITIALNTFPGLSTDRAFEEGVAYNRALDGAKAQAERGWKVGVQAIPHAGNTAELAVAVADHDGRPLDGARVVAEFQRPTVTGHDVTLPLGERGGGRYGAVAQLPMPGVWDVRLTIVRPDGDHQSVHRIVVKE